MSRWEFEEVLEDAGFTSLYGPRTDDELERNSTGRVISTSRRGTNTRSRSFSTATVFSNYASTDWIGLLVSILESPVVVPAVRDEIEREHRFGHGYLATAVEAFDDGLRISDVPTETVAVQLRDSTPVKRTRCARLSSATGHSRPTISRLPVSPTS